MPMQFERENNSSINDGDAESRRHYRECRGEHDFDQARHNSLPAEDNSHSSSTQPSSYSGDLPATIARGVPDRCPESGLALSAENLPVLNAFNEFLEAERRSTRRRFRALLYVFALLLLSTAAGGLVAGRFVIQRMRGEITAETQVIQAGLSEAAATAGDLRRDMELRDRAVRHTHFTLQRHIDGQTGAVAQIHDSMSDMKLELAILENSIRELIQREKETAEKSFVEGNGLSVVEQHDLDARIAHDFAPLRRLAEIYREHEQEKLEYGSALYAEPDGPLREGFIPPVSVEIETPRGLVPWRMRSTDR